MIHRPDQPDDVNERLELSYPCEWRYRVIGTDAARIRAAIVDIAGELEHLINEGNTSSGGRYVSLELALTVSSESERLRIFKALAAHGDVRLVM